MLGIGSGYPVAPAQEAPDGVGDDIGNLEAQYVRGVREMAPPPISVALPSNLTKLGPGVVLSRSISRTAGPAAARYSATERRKTCFTAAL